MIGILELERHEAKSRLAALWLAGLGAVWSSSAVAQTVTYTNGTNYPIPAHGTMTSNIIVPDFGGLAVINDLDVSLTFHHGNWGEIGVTVSHGATTVPLITYPNGGNTDSTTYVLDDSADSSISDQGGIAGGTFRPQPPGILADFNGQLPDGTWSLNIVDQFGGTEDEVFNSWSVIFTLDLIDQVYLGVVVQDIVAGDVRQLIGSLEDRKSAAWGGGMEPAGDAANPFNAAPGEASSRLWARMGAAKADGEGAVTNLFVPETTSYDENMSFFQGGGSFIIMNTGDNRIVASAFGHYVHSDSDVSDTLGAAGTIDAAGYGGGASLTWLATNGLYADALGMVVAHNLDVEAASGATGNTNALTLAASGELGFRIDLGGGFSLVPQAQLVYENVKIDSFTDSDAITYAFNNSDSFDGRAGVNLEMSRTLGTEHQIKFNLGANAVHEFLDGGTAVINGTALGYGGSEGNSFLLVGGLSVTPLGDGFHIGAQGNYLVPLGNEGRESVAVSATFGWIW